MPDLLIATDSPTVFDEVCSAVEEPGVVDPLGAFGRVRAARAAAARRRPGHL